MTLTSAMSSAGRWCAEEIASRFVQVLESMTEQKHTGEIEPLTAAVPPTVIWWNYGLTGGAIGTVWIGASSEVSHALGGAVLVAAGVESDPETAATTFSEIVTQALSAVGQSISARVHQECNFGAPATGESPDLAEVGQHRVALAANDGTHYELFTAISPSILSTLAESVHAVDSALVPAPQPEQLVRTASAPVQTSATLDLLMDVELPVSVSFGRAQLQIKEVLKLASGSIIELNRHISEPVELIVNNCVIARGEVVVIEGNYGVRIDQIISPQERLRTLK